MKKFSFLVFCISLLVFFSCIKNKCPQGVTGSPSSGLSEVVTIYFCGTGITKEWRGKASKFDSPELISTLHHEQKKGEYSGVNHNKLIVDGVGTGSNNIISNIFERGVPLREWERCLKEANSYLKSVVEQTAGDITLNLVGFSRGAVLCMWMAHEASSEKRIGRINILCFDPVPGDLPGDLKLVPEGIYFLGKKVKNYVGIYSEDERTSMFEPVIPAFFSPGAKQWVFTVPGGHETMVGNKQKDGHHTKFDFPIDDALSENLGNISWVTKVIAVKLLGSKDWGQVAFENAWNGEQDHFVKSYDAMFRLKEEELEKIRKVGFIPNSIKAYWAKFEGKPKCHLCTSKKDYNHHRCALKVESNGRLMDVGLQDVVHRQTGEQAWKKLKEVTTAFD